MTSIASAPAGAATSAPAKRYRSRFLADLVIFRWMIIGLLAVMAFLGCGALTSLGSVVKTIGEDTKASVVAAETIRTDLAQSHAAFIAAIANGEGTGGPTAALARQKIGDVMDALTDAAKNITYGAEEANPIDTILRGITAYEADVGAAQRLGKGDLHALQAADSVMRWTLLPAAATLDRVNAEHLEGAYRQRTAFTTWASLAALAGVACLVALAMLQAKIRAKTRRQTSPLLAAATALLFVGTAVSSYYAVDAFREIRVAKEDAFDSISAMWSARSDAAGALAAANEMALPIDGTEHGKISDRYAFASRSILDGSMTLDGRDPSRHPKLSGLLGDEAANVTFPGEERAAQNAIAAWRAFDQTARTNDAVGDTSNLAPLFRGADAAMAAVIKINDDAFEDWIARARNDVRTAIAAVIAVASSAALLAWFGIGIRIREYRP